MHQSFSLSLMNPNDVPDFAVFARFFKEPSIIMKGLSMLLPQFFRMVISNESENDSWTIWTTICRLKPTYSSFKLYVFSVFCAPIFFTLICKFFLCSVVYILSPCYRISSFHFLRLRKNCEENRLICVRGFWEITKRFWRREAKKISKYSSKTSNRLSCWRNNLLEKL